MHYNPFAYIPVSYTHLSICKEGVDAIGSALKELETAGYIVRRQLRGANGRITDTEYIIYEQPQPKKLDMLPSDVVSPDTENPDMVKPDTEKPVSYTHLPRSIIVSAFKKTGGTIIRIL